MTNRVFGRKNTNSDGLPVADVGEDLYVATGYTTTPDGKQVPKLNRVETEDPAMAGLENLGDVTYLRQKVWSFVPADIVGIKRNTSGDLDSQDLAYARLLRRAQRQLEVGIRQILDQVLLAAGRMDVEYRVIFPVITVGAAWKHSDARFKDSMTLRNYLEMDVISRRYALKRSFNLSDREVEDVWQQIVDERNSGIFIPVLPNRNGQPSAAGSSDDFAKGKPSDPSLPSAPKTVPGMPNPDATTNSGISRGTKMSKIGRGNMSGG